MAKLVQLKDDQNEDITPVVAASGVVMPDGSGIETYISNRVPTKTSDLINDNNFINQGSADGKYLPINNPVATGSFSLGRKEDTTIGTNSFAVGSSIEASGQYSHAEGAYTHASGYCSHAEGEDTTAANQCSHAEGHRTTASGQYSHAEGDNTTASGVKSHAEGYSTKASGARSHAEGYDTKSQGEASHAEGDVTVASGYASHAEGSGTIAQMNFSHVSGHYNIPDDSSLVIVGNGSSNDARSNAYSLDGFGNAKFAGDVTLFNGKLMKWLYLL